MSPWQLLGRGALRFRLAKRGAAATGRGGCRADASLPWDCGIRPGESALGMIESLTGFAVVGFAILVGWIIGRIDLLGEHARPVLSRLTFFVLSPFLLFVVLPQADVRTLFSALLPVSAIAAASVIAVFAVFARLLWRRPLGETVIGAASAGLVNANNISIPLSLYL